MFKISKALLARIGKATLRVAGITGGGEEAKIAKAQLELSELRVEVAAQALRDIVSLSAKNDPTTTDLRAHLREVHEIGQGALDVLKRSS